MRALRSFGWLRPHDKQFSRSPLPGTPKSNRLTIDPTLNVKKALEDRERVPRAGMSTHGLRKRFDVAEIVASTAQPFIFPYP